METVYTLINNKILNDNFTSIFRSGYINIKGVTMPVSFRDYYKPIENWSVYDDDVWICSFPKTGTTWTQEMVWLIMNGMNFEEAKTSLGERFPFLDHNILFDYSKVMEGNKDFKAPDFFMDSVKFTGEQPRPRFIKTHLAWNLLPKAIQDGEKKPKIIYVTRNPKDTCVSYYHHCRLIEGYQGNFEDFCNLFFDGNVIYGPYWSNVLQFWERRNQDNVLFIRYEDLKNDLSSSIKKVATFLEKSMTEEEIERLKDHLKFENMKKNKAVNYESFVELNKKYKLIEQEGCFMRSGTVGGYKTEMSEELIDQFDAWIRKHDPNNELGY